MSEVHHSHADPERVEPPDLTTYGPGDPLGFGPTSKATVICPECRELVEVHDVQALLLGLHQRVCHALELVNGTGE